MKNFDSRTYSISDFLEWNNNGLLVLSPDFQRRSVWSEKAKSYLIDTIIRGKPIPKVLMTQQLEGPRTIRVVVDGQQRLRSILEFINGDFKISRAHNEEFAGKMFPTLLKTTRESFLQYELGVDLLFDISDEDILDIFARINSYTVTLNNEEIFNAKYFGYFKQYVFKYGYKYVKYLIDSSILTKSQVTRMGEAKLTADLFVALLDGVQTNKGIEQFYKDYEEESNGLKQAATRFDMIMSYIGEIYKPEEIAQTNWSRIHLFYTLFTAIAHFLYGLKGPKKIHRCKITKSSIGKLRVQLDEISSRYDEISENMDDESLPAEYKKFITWSRRGTTDTITRIERTNFVCRKLKQAFKK